jgi:Polyketide cyclase / dehydrase and lipid transport
MIKKIFKIALIAMLVLLVIYVGICAVAPAQPVISVTKNLKAAPAALYNQFSDYKHWDAWSIWHNGDPTMKIEYQGASNEVGGSYSWDGKKMGKGSQKIIELIPNEKMRTEMRFEGFDIAYYADLLLKPTATGTEATWIMTQEKETPFLYRGMGYMMNSTLKKQFVDNFNAMDSCALKMGMPQALIDSTNN